MIDGREGLKNDDRAGNGELGREREREERDRRSRKKKEEEEEREKRVTGGKRNKKDVAR